MVIIYQANVRGSQHSVACDKHANEAGSRLYNRTVGAQRQVFHPPEKKAVSSQATAVHRENKRRPSMSARASHSLWDSKCSWREVEGSIYSHLRLCSSLFVAVFPFLKKKV